MKIDVGFAGGLKVEARVGRHRVVTDQPVAQGGEGSAPSPLALFFAALATCAGYYALRFCLAREIPTTGLTASLETFYREEGALARIEIRIGLPHGFPDRYREAIRRAAEQCAVNQFVLEPAPIEILTERPEPVPAG